MGLFGFEQCIYFEFAAQFRRDATRRQDRKPFVSAPAMLHSSSMG
jgi:hypothetical protein